MPFIEMPLGDVGEQYTVPGGSYNLTVLKVSEEASKAKREEDGQDADPNMLVVTLGIQSDEYPDAAPFREWFTYPDGGDYDDMRMRELKRFLYWFNVPMEANGFNTEDVEGATAENITITREVLDSGREVNGLSLDPVPTEEGGEGEAAAEEEQPEEQQEEEQTEEEQPAEEEEEAPAPTRRTAPAKKPTPVAKKPAPKVAPKVAPKKAPKRR